MQIFLFVKYFIIGSSQSWIAAMAQGDQSEGNDDDEDDSGGGYIFSTTWPLVVVLIAVGVLIAVIVVGCRKRCPSIKRTHPDASHNRSPSTAHRRRRTEDAVSLGHVFPVNPGNPLSGVWTVEGTSPRDELPPPIIMMNPPSYCESPPAYEDLITAPAAEEACPEDWATGCSRRQNSPTATASPEGGSLATTTKIEYRADRRLLEENNELNVSVRHPSTPDVRDSGAMAQCTKSTVFESAEDAPHVESRDCDVSPSAGNNDSDDGAVVDSGIASTNVEPHIHDNNNGGEGMDMSGSSVVEGSTLH